MRRKKTRHSGGMIGYLLVVGSTFFALWLILQFPESDGSDMALMIPIEMAIFVGAVFLYWVVRAWMGKLSVEAFLMMVVLLIITYMFYTNSGELGFPNPCPGDEIGISRAGECLRGLDLP